MLQITIRDRLRAVLHLIRPGPCRSYDATSGVITHQGQYVVRTQCKHELAALDPAVLYHITWSQPERWAGGHELKEPSENQSSARAHLSRILCCCLIG